MEITLENITQFPRAEKAMELHKSGFNCAQAVFRAFSDLYPFDEDTAALIAGPLGGGLGGQHEVCGAVSGMFFVLGTLYGYAEPDPEAQKETYAKVQDLAAKFRASAGTIICRELLTNPPTDPNPTPRTAEFYAKRPCVYLVMLAASLLDEFIAENPIP